VIYLHLCPAGYLAVPDEGKIRYIFLGHAVWVIVGGKTVAPHGESEILRGAVLQHYPGNRRSLGYLHEAVQAHEAEAVPRDDEKDAAMEEQHEKASPLEMRPLPHAQDEVYAKEKPCTHEPDRMEDAIRAEQGRNPRYEAVSIRDVSVPLGEHGPDQAERCDEEEKRYRELQRREPTRQAVTIVCRLFVIRA